MALNRSPETAGFQFCNNVINELGERNTLLKKVPRLSIPQVMDVYRNIKDTFARRKWTLLIIAWSTAIICLHWQSVSDRDFIHETEDIDSQKPVFKIKHYDVLLNSYMRAGSTLTGSVFGHRTDSFFLYEPLWKISRWTYWHGNNMVCRSDRPECRHVDQGKAVEDRSFVDNLYRRPSGSLEMAKKILRKTYDCQFNDYERTVVEPSLTAKLGGPSWNKTRRCLYQHVNYQACFQRHIPRICKDSTHKVTKVLRLTTDILSSVLLSRDNLKVIHLFRDPRAIINSRINTGWYTTDSEVAVIENAKSLCNRMFYDFLEGKKVQKKYPDRFRFVYYEDFSTDILNKSKILYKYLGMNVSERYYPEVMKIPVFKNAAAAKTERERNSAFWWRNTLKWEIVEKMEKICKDVYKELGYKSFANEQDYRDSSKPSLVMPKQYLIV